MENKINIAELLKDCPSGMKLDCTLFEGLEFDSIVDNDFLPIRCRIENSGGGYNVYNFTKYGCWVDMPFAKCVIFPKGKTTWEGFQRPFKDGDIIFVTNNESNEDFHYKYMWNGKNKTLKKLVEPKFKVGDWVEFKYYERKPAKVIRIENNVYYLSSGDTLMFQDEYAWDLTTNKFDITTLKPFDKVLVRYNKDYKWCCSFFSYIDKDLHSHCYKFVTTAGTSYPMMIPYEGNEHLCGTTNDCDEYYKTWE